jgi:hypothetical protein
VILKHEVMPLLLEACPSYRERWLAYCSNPVFEPGLSYLDLADFADHLVELLRSGSTDEFEAVFEAIERMHLEGDEFVREAATIGALEGLQNIAGNIDSERFVPYLKTTSKKQWEKLNNFWDGEKSIS